MSHFGAYIPKTTPLAIQLHHYASVLLIIFLILYLSYLSQQLYHYTVYYFRGPRFNFRSSEAPLHQPPSSPNSVCLPAGSTVTDSVPRRSVPFLLPHECYHKFISLGDICVLNRQDVTGLSEFQPGSLSQLVTVLFRRRAIGVMRPAGYMAVNSFHWIHFLDGVLPSFLCSLWSSLLCLTLCSLCLLFNFSHFPF